MKRAETNMDLQESMMEARGSISGDLARNQYLGGGKALTDMSRGGARGFGDDLEGMGAQKGFLGNAAYVEQIRKFE